MRSLLMFFSCFCFFGVAVYLVVIVLKKPELIASEAHAAVGPTVYLPSVVRSIAKGDIVKVTDLIWIPYGGYEALEGFLNRESILKMNSPYFSLKRSVEIGGILKESDFYWSTDKGFLANILKPGYRAVEIRILEGLLERKTISTGSYIDLQWTESQGAGAFVVARNVRVLDLQSIGNGKCTVILEVNTKQAEIISVSRSLGSLSLLLMANSEFSQADDLDEIVQKLQALSPQNTERVSRIPDKPIIIQRGGKITIMTKIADLPTKNKAPIFSGITERGEK